MVNGSPILDVRTLDLPATSTTIYLLYYWLASAQQPLRSSGDDRTRFHPGPTSFLMSAGCAARVNPSESNQGSNDRTANCLEIQSGFIY